MPLGMPPRRTRGVSDRWRCGIQAVSGSGILLERDKTVKAAQLSLCGQRISSISAASSRSSWVATTTLSKHWQHWTESTLHFCLQFEVLELDLRESSNHSKQAKTKT